jgi:HAD superfamily hydrolase (TIGR01509 family)
LISHKTSREAGSGRARTKTRFSSGKGTGLPALLFDLDGTLIDSVYEHVAAWSGALRSEKIMLSNWAIHRHIGMSGSSFVKELTREAKRKRSMNIERLEAKHDAAFNKVKLEVLPGSAALLRHLIRVKVKFAIATTGGKAATTRLLSLLNVPQGVAVVTGDDVKRAKPAPDVFVLAAEKLGVPIGDCIVIGDSTWDVLAAARKSALGVGLLSGGYSREELERAGAFRVYADPADLLLHIEDLGIPGE